MRLILAVLGGCAGYLAGLDFLKVAVLRHFRDAANQREVDS